MYSLKGIQLSDCSNMLGMFVANPSIIIHLNALNKAVQRFNTGSSYNI